MAVVQRKIASIAAWSACWHLYLSLENRSSARKINHFANHLRNEPFIKRMCCCPAVFRLLRCRQSWTGRRMPNGQRKRRRSSLLCRPRKAAFYSAVFRVSLPDGSSSDSINTSTDYRATLHDRNAIHQLCAGRCGGFGWLSAAITRNPHRSSLQQFKSSRLESGIQRRSTHCSHMANWNLERSKPILNSWLFEKQNV